MCVNPIKCWQYYETDSLTGEEKTHLVFNINKTSFNKDKDYSVEQKLEDLYIPGRNQKLYNRRIKPITLPCGKCPDCLMKYSLEWAYRIMNEASYYAENCFMTLTYANTNGELCLKDIQNFLKRLRKKISPLKIRFFNCGEYGSKGKRPHFHCIIFGWCPSDLKFLKKTKKGQIIYTSEIVSSLWKHGFVSIGNVEFESAKYTALYMQKLHKFPDKKVQPFLTMSNRPGIGYKYVLDKKNTLLLTDKVYNNGKDIPLPRYYLKVLENQQYCDTSTLRVNREKKKDLILEEENVRAYKLAKYDKLLHWKLEKGDT
ncbi:replication initiator protein [Capybara microvirus Cap3_SP_478]|nr:replication initiator protein [Capybara microvirus Cap3_SP_478]